jgi:hypothetical protein
LLLNEDSFDLFAILLGPKLSPFYLAGAEAHLRGELVDLFGDESQESRVALFGPVVSFSRTQGHQVAPLPV